MDNTNVTYLALDLGRKHTGVSFADATVAIALPLDTIHHDDEDGLIEVLTELMNSRKVETIVLGLPLLMKGDEGEEAEHVRGVADRIKEEFPACDIEFLDERETSKIYYKEAATDRHAEAATRILSVFLERLES